MSNYINCQLKVEGTAVRLEELKNSTIINYENHYDVNLNHLTNGKDGVINYKLSDSRESYNENMLPLVDTLCDFEFDFRGNKTFYEWVSHSRFAHTTIWVDDEWERVSLANNILTVNFTAAWTPPIIEIMLGSKLYPDLKFRLSFVDISDGFEHNTIEGMNAEFKEVIRTFNN